MDKQMIEDIIKSGEDLKAYNYKSPIDIIQEQVKLDFDGAIYKAVQNVHINVDREELIKALQYDRNQYDKGYSDGMKEAVKKFAERLKKQFTGVRTYEYRDTGTAWGEPCIGGFINNKIDEICKEITEGKNEQSNE